MAFRSDLPIEWNFPAGTHSLDALLWQQWISDEYWNRFQIARRDRPEVPRNVVQRIARLKKAANKPASHAWVTVRDAISDLPTPAPFGGESSVANHIFVPGARTYAKHTGSPLDLPAKTLKAGDHGVPGGENMLREPDGTVRYFTIRECARLQTFPDDYQFSGGWKRLVRQLGNAVPVRMAQTIGRDIHRQLVELAAVGRR